MAIKSKRRASKTKAWTVAGFKIARPSSDYPLSPHGSGKWQKKINGETHYFGAWAKRVDGKLERIEGDGWQEALATYNRQADALHAGRTPRITADSLNVAELCNRFLTAKLRKMESRELSPRSFAEYRQATDLLISAFGKTRPVDDIAADDFESLRAGMAKRWGPARLGKFVILIRSIFNYAKENNLIDREVRFGSEFTKPGKATMRKHKEAGDKKLFAADEIRTILDALTGQEMTVKKKTGKVVKVQLTPNPQLRAAVLLACNAGLGNTDISSLEFKHLDLRTKWLNFPRIKSGLPRRAPLWNETVEALNDAIARRRPHKSLTDANCVFTNRAGRRMVQATERSNQDYVSSQFRAVLRELGINGRRGIGFYSLRHSFATIGLQTTDRDAVRYLMGHAAHDMLSAYDETGPSDARLQAVVEHVRQWLFGIKEAT
jgi:integrase